MDLDCSQHVVCEAWTQWNWAILPKERIEDGPGHDSMLPLRGQKQLIMKWYKVNIRTLGKLDKRDVLGVEHVGGYPASLVISSLRVGSHTVHRGLTALSQRP